jgi:hypothetical protein
MVERICLNALARRLVACSDAGNWPALAAADREVALWLRTHACTGAPPAGLEELRKAHELALERVRQRLVQLQSARQACAAYMSHAGTHEESRWAW